MKGKINIVAALLTAGVLASCSTEEGVMTSPDNVIERIDMVLEGNVPEYIYRQNLEDGSGEDLIQFNYYGSPSNKIDFKVNLDGQRTLVFKVVNETDYNPWESEDSYSMYATRDFEDKQKYVIAELLSGGEVPMYSSNHGDNFPQGTYVDVFRIEEIDPETNEILCRIVDLPMVSVSGSYDDIIIVNGTFRGSLSFLE